MKRALLFLSCAVVALGQNAHPRILLTPTLVSTLRSIAGNSSDPRYATWLAVKAQADAYASQPLFTQTITNCTNSNPVQCTTVETAIGSGQLFYIGGGTGAWAAMNRLSASTGGPWTITKTGTNTFTIPVDSTQFGPYSGQSLVVFCYSTGATGTISYTYEGIGWQDAIFNLGVAWVATGKPTYATKALQLLDYINRLGAVGMDAPESVDSGYPSRSYMFSLAVLYDWFYSQLSSAEKTATAATVNLDYTWYLAHAYSLNGTAYSNYWGGHILGFGAMGWASYEDNSNAPAIVKTIRTNWNSLIPAAFTSPNGYAAGYPVQGTNYAPNDFVRKLQWMLIQKTANNEDMFASTNYAQLITTQLIHMLYPNKWQLNSEGDQPGACSGIELSWLPIFLSYAASGTTQGAWAQYYYQNVNTGSEPSACVSTTNPTNYDLLLWYDPTRTATNYTLTQPTYWYSEGDRHSYYRSDWTSSAIFGSFMGSGATWDQDHQNRVWGHAEIARGADWLLTNAGEWKGSTGITGSPQNYEITTNDVSNTLLWNDNGIYNFANSDCSVNPRYCGGQAFWGTQGTNFHTENANYVYQLSDLTQGYDISTSAQNATNRTLRSYWRSWLAVGDGTFVVLDRALAKASTYIKKDRWFTNTTAPSISGHQFTSTAGSSKLFGTVVFPSTAQLTSSNKTYGAGVYYVEVSDSATSASFTPMTVFYATSSGGSMPPIQNLSNVSANFYGIEIDDTNPKVVVQSYDLQALGNAYQGYGPVLYTSATYTTVSAFTGQRVKHFVTQLKPGTYGVTQSGTSIGNITAGADGSAYFTSTGGGAFVIGAPSTAGPGGGGGGGGPFPIAAIQAVPHQPPSSFQIGYAANLGVADSVVNFSNSGVNGGFAGATPATLGNVCVNVYAFDSLREEIACCACLATPNSLNALSIKSDLIDNPATPAVPSSVMIDLLASQPAIGGDKVNYTVCNPATAGSATPLESGVLAWGITLEPNPTPSSYQAVPMNFISAALSVSELSALTSACNFIQANAAGFGICQSCRTGALGGVQR